MISEAGFVAQLEGVDYAYRDKPVLKGLSLHVSVGKVYGLLGRNGAGKSTTMKLLVGQIIPSTGSVRLFGRSFERGLLARVGASIDGPALYGCLSARDNLRIHADLIGVEKDRVDQMLQVVGLDNTGKAPSSRFSTGMKARLALAIALLGDPDLLILDEPQNGLDPEGIRSLRGLLREFVARGKSVLISSHALGEIEHIADDIGVLQGGSLCYEGPLERLAPDGDLERAYFRLSGESGR